jgi:hypothetical protein
LLCPELFHDRLQLKRIYLTAYQLKEFHHSEAIHHISPSDNHVALLQIGNYSRLEVDQQLTFNALLYPFNNQPERC